MTQKYFFSAEMLSEWIDPESIFINLYAGKDHAFWLDSSRVIEGFSRFSYIGEAAKVIRYAITDGDIFSILEKELSKIRIPKTTYPFLFAGGYVGYFGYEVKQLCGFSNNHISEFPDAMWYFVDRFFIFDHKEKKMYLGCLTTDKKDAAHWIEKTKTILQKGLVSNERKKEVTITALQLELDKTNYLQAINECKMYLHKGESYEICLTNRMRGISYENSLDIYRRLRQSNPAPYAAYFHDKDFAILCSSPERFLTLDQEGWVESKPMKGTISRSTNTTADRKRFLQLQESEKDRAENLMIVDLVRNDLGRVCTIGSVQVPELMKVETYQTVHQMISVIRGKLRSTVSPIACIKACFPGGSMTGAPKKRTIKILDRLEKSARGVYSGALGFLSANGTVDLNMLSGQLLNNKRIFRLV
jgi:para-aminobenzoate synthetase